MINKDGKTVAPDVGPSRPPPPMPTGPCAGFYLILTDQPGAKSWPITAATFILMHKQPEDKAARPKR